MATKGGWNGNSLPEEQQEDTFYDISVLENELASSPSSPSSDNNGLGGGISEGSHSIQFDEIDSNFKTTSYMGMQYAGQSAPQTPDQTNKHKQTNNSFEIYWCDNKIFFTKCSWNTWKNIKQLLLAPPWNLDWPSTVSLFAELRKSFTYLLILNPLFFSSCSTTNSEFWNCQIQNSVVVSKIKIWIEKSRQIGHGYFSELHHQKLASIRRKEALLRRKKTLLKQLIKKLRLLIQQSERDRKEDGTSGSGSGSGPDQMTSPNKMIASQIIPQEKDKSLFYQKEYATPNADHVKPWWERIMSNKHWFKIAMLKLRTYDFRCTVVRLYEGTKKLQTNRSKALNIPLQSFIALTTLWLVSVVRSYAGATEESRYPRLQWCPIPYLNIDNLPFQYFWDLLRHISFYRSNLVIMVDALVRCLPTYILIYHICIRHMLIVIMYVFYCYKYIDWADRHNV